MFKFLKRFNPFSKPEPEVGLSAKQPTWESVVHAEKWVKDDTTWLKISEILKQILADKESGSYIGGTLAIQFGGKVVLLNLEIGNPPLIEFFLAKIYIKHKTSTNSHWFYCKRVVEKQEKFLALTGAASAVYNNS